MVGPFLTLYIVMIWDFILVEWVSLRGGEAHRLTYVATFRIVDWDTYVAIFENDDFLVQAAHYVLEF